MLLELYAAFIAATVVLMLIPGPNVALIVANSVAHGPRYGLITVAGTSAAMVVQLALTALGTASAMTALSGWFGLLRWVGVVYLLYLGIKTWREPPTDLSRTQAEPRSIGSIFMRGFAVSLTNPKTLFFYGAFFPQFLDPHGPVGSQLVVLAMTFLALAVVLDGAWALLAGRFRIILAMHGRLRNRITGGVFIAAGVGLAAARRTA